MCANGLPYHRSPSLQLLVEEEERKWKVFFNDPSQWWDNRCKDWRIYPHFRHATTNQDLWITSPHCPLWVHNKLKSLRAAVPSQHVRARYVKIQEQLQLAEVDRLLAELKKCTRVKDLTRGAQLHSQASSSGLLSNRYVTNSLITMYAVCGSMLDARAVFDGLFHLNDVVSWNALLQGYVDNGESELALKLFDIMLEKAYQPGGGCVPNTRTYIAALVACVSLAGRQQYGKCSSSPEVNRKWLEKGKMIHFEAVKSSCCDIYVESILIDMYAHFGCMEQARSVFDCMVSHNVVSWTALLQGYVDNGESELALELFDVMVEKSSKPNGTAPNSRTYIAALTACAALAETTSLSKWLEKGKEVHHQAVRSSCCDKFVETALVNMYAKCWCMIDARDVFDRMVSRDVVSWNCLVQGYVDNGDHESALELISRMEDVQTDVQPNSATYLAGLLACGSLLAVETGKAFHSHIRELGLDQDVAVATRVVDFYAKVGIMETAAEVFDSIPVKDVWTWNTLMSGYSQQGDAEQVFELLERMREQGVTPNEVTFTCVLSACSHAGLTSRGREFFESMKSEYGIRPDMLHYTCMVDLLSRANCLEEALRILGSMPFEADRVIWSTLLGGCHKWNNVRVGKVAYEALVKVDGRDASAHVLMANLQASVGVVGVDSAVDVVYGQGTVQGQTWWTEDTTRKVHKFVSGGRCCSETLKMLWEMRKLSHV